jgi:hypothetical protein
MKKKLLVLLFSLASLALVSCGGGNDGASTGTPVVAQATLFNPTANGGCGNSTNLGGSGETLTATQFTACSNALIAATTVNQCIALGGTCGVPYYGCWGGWLASPGANCYAGTTGAN